MVKASEEEESFKESLRNNIYFTTRGCEENGSVKIDMTLFNFIYNIAGMCTDPSETPDYHNNPRAMFVALDLIWKAFNEVEKDEQAKRASKFASKENKETKTEGQ